MKYVLPKLNGEVGRMSFELNNGGRSKEFYFAEELNKSTGSYPIYDSNNKIVEYMDIIGNFSNKPTAFALDFYNYVTYESMSWLVLTVDNLMLFECALNEFPSKYLADEKIVKLVKEEEKRKYRTLCEMKQLTSLIDKLMYKKYVSKCLKMKLKRAEVLRKHLETLSQENEHEI